MNKLNNKFLLEEINKKIDRRYEKWYLKNTFKINKPKNKNKKKKIIYLFVMKKYWSECCLISNNTIIYIFIKIIIINDNNFLNIF